VLAQLRGAVAGDAVEWRTDHGVGEVVLGKLQRGGGILLSRSRLDHLGLQHRKLLLRRNLLRLRGNHRCVGLARVRNRLVIGLVRRPAASHQRSGSAGIGSGTRLFGLGLNDGSLGGIDRGRLLGDLPLGCLDRGRGLGSRGGCLGEAGAPVRRIQHDQGIAGTDPLVVGYLDGDHITLDARAQDRDVALDIGVVGAFDVPALGEPPRRGDADPDRHHQAGRRTPPPTQTARAGRPGRGLDFRRNGLRLRGDGIHSGLL
jgi:hypothetical protein